MNASCVLRLSWAYMAAFSQVQGDLSRLEAITQEAVSRLKDCDLSPQIDFLSCLKAKDSSRYEASLESGTG
jgi:hypothetical protein